jgi:rhamnogalacturonan endolyase
MRFLSGPAILLSSTALAIFSATQNNASLTLANERLVASVSKSRGNVNFLTLDGQNLLVSWIRQ